MQMFQGVAHALLLPEGEQLFPSALEASKHFHKTMEPMTNNMFELTLADSRSVFTRLQYFIQRDLLLPHRRKLLLPPLRAKSSLSLILHWDYARICKSKKYGERGASLLQVGVLEFGSSASNTRLHYNIAVVDAKDDADVFLSHFVQPNTRIPRGNGQQLLCSVMDDLEQEIDDPWDNQPGLEDMGPRLETKIKSRVELASLDLCAIVELTGAAGIRNER